MTNETTASERERCPFCGSHSTGVRRGADGWLAVRCLDCGALGPCIDLTEEGANAKWNARAALPAPADQPPSQEARGSSGSLPESSVEARAQDAAPAFDPLSGPTEIRRRAAIAEAAWWCKNAARHVRFVSIDAASSIDDRTAAVRAADEAIDKLAALL